MRRGAERSRRGCLGQGRRTRASPFSRRLARTLRIPRMNCERRVLGALLGESNDTVTGPRGRPQRSLSEPFVEVPTATRANRASSRETHYGLPLSIVLGFVYPEFGANFDSLVAPLSGLADRRTRASHSSRSLSVAAARQSTWGSTANT